MEQQRIKEEAIQKGIEIERQKDEVRKERDEAVTRDTLQNELNSKTVMKCPRCGAFVMKISGCAHLNCLLCKMTFNWVGGNN